MCFGLLITGSCGQVAKWSRITDNFNRQLYLKNVNTCIIDGKRKSHHIVDQKYPLCLSFFCFVNSQLFCGIVLPLCLNFCDVVFPGSQRSYAKCYFSEIHWNKRPAHQLVKRQSKLSLILSTRCCCVVKLSVELTGII